MRVLGLACVLVGCGRVAFDPTGDGGGGGGGGGGDGGYVQPDANLVFITATSTPPLGGSLHAFDMVCQARAQAESFSGTFIAYMSSASMPIKTRLTGARGFVRYDGLAIADQPTEIAEALLRPVMFDETGAVVPHSTPIMTGSDVSGNDNSDCNNYVFSGGSVRGGYADGTYDDFDARTLLPCSGSYPMYCVETDRVVTLTEPPPTGRRVFLSKTGAVPTSLGAADTFCTGNATGAGLTGTFHALLATETASAASRFSAAGANWTRLDGVAIAATPGDFLAGNWIAPIDLQPDGVTHVRAGVLFGASDPTQVGTTASTCASWTVTTGAMVPSQGDSSSIATGFLDPAFAATCGAGNYLYCVEP